MHSASPSECDDLTSESHLSYLIASVNPDPDYTDGPVAQNIYVYMVPCKSLRPPLDLLFFQV